MTAELQNNNKKRYHLLGRFIHYCSLCKQSHKLHRGKNKRHVTISLFVLWAYHRFHSIKLKQKSKTLIAYLRTFFFTIVLSRRKKEEEKKISTDFKRNLQSLWGNCSVHSPHHKANCPDSVFKGVIPSAPKGTVFVAGRKVVFVPCPCDISPSWTLNYEARQSYGTTT